MSHLLKCEVCLLPTSTPPVFQCENGHVACHSCRIKTRNRCRSCDRANGQMGYPAIQKVMEFSKVFCPRSLLGCNKVFSFNDYFERLLHHFINEHSASPTSHFHYNNVFSVFLTKDDPFLVMKAEEDNCFFVLYNKKESTGNLIMVFFAKPSSPSSTTHDQFLYNVSVSRNESSSTTRSLRFHSVMKGVKGLEECCSPTEFLLVPRDFFGESEEMKLDVCIWHSDIVKRKKLHFSAHNRVKVEHS